MDELDNRKAETFWEAERRKEQDNQDEHRLSLENELRRKRGLPEVPYYVKDLRTPAEIRADKDFRLKCLNEAKRKTEQLMIARYLIKLKKDLENE